MLKDFEVNIRVKLSVLWTAVTLLYLYGDYFELYIPHKVDGLLTGENMLDDPGKLFLASLLLAIPAAMVLLSISLNPIWSKWLNVVFGVFFTAIMLLIAITSISPWRTYYVFYAILESMITSAIVWSALKWPKLENRK